MKQLIKHLKLFVMQAVVRVTIVDKNNILLNKVSIVELLKSNKKLLLIKLNLIIY